MSDLTLNEIDALLAALREKAATPNAGPDDALTANELERELGGKIHRKRLLAVIDALWREGRVEAVKVYRQFPTRLAKVDAYRFKS